MTCTARVVAVTLSMVVLTTGGWLRTSHAQDPQGQVQPEEEKGQVQERAVPGLPGVQPPATLAPNDAIESVTLNQSSVTGGAPVEGTVTIHAFPQLPFGRLPVLVTIQSSNPALAATLPRVVIPPGQTSAIFTIQTAPTSSPTAIAIIAQVGSSRKVAQLTVVPPQLISQIMTLGVPVVGGAVVSWIVTLTGPAPSQGLVVTLASQNPAVANAVPQRITVLPGATRGGFNVATQPVSVPTTVMITASLGTSIATGIIEVFPSQH